MPFLDTIVTGLNDNWVNKSLCFLQPHTIKCYGISDIVYDVAKGEDGQEKQVRYPAVVDEFGDAHKIVPDDDYAVILYHRIEGIVNSVAPKTGFGDTAGDQLETVNMSLVVLAFGKKVKKPAYWLEAAIKDKMPESFSQKTPDGKFAQASVFRVGNSSFDKLQILGRDNSEVELPFDLVLFELKYRIENTWRKGCFLQCNC